MKSAVSDSKTKAAPERPNPFTLSPLPEPVLPVAEAPWGIVVAGVGGTGVITIGQLLGMAAHLEGKGIVTQDSAGLAQKGGATWSHVQIANRMDAINTTKVGTAEADLVIGCVPIVAANKATLAAMREGRTYVALNTQARRPRPRVTNPTGSPGRQLRGGDRRRGRARRCSAKSMPTSLAIQLVGDRRTRTRRCSATRGRRVACRSPRRAARAS